MLQASVQQHLPIKLLFAGITSACSASLLLTGQRLLSSFLRLMEQLQARLGLQACAGSGSSGSVWGLALLLSLQQRATATQLRSSHLVSRKLCLQSGCCSLSCAHQQMLCQQQQVSSSPAFQPTTQECFTEVAVR
jgi:hypothetical protein